jgi:acyl-CoA hydrolase
MIRLDADQAIALLATRLSRTGGRVFVATAGTEPLIFAKAYGRNPDAAEGLTFVSAAIPGVNQKDWSRLHATSRGEGIFVSPDWRDSFDEGRFALVPQAYSEAWRWLCRTPLDAALVQVSAPDADGMCSFGTSCDFQPAVLGRDVFKIAHVNPDMPAPARSPKVALASFDVVVEASMPMMTYDPGPLDPTFATIARNVADYIVDGAAIQVGLGKMGFAVMNQIKDRKRLSVKSGMVIDPLLELMDCGAIAEDQDAIVTGAALGSQDLIDRLSQDPRVRFTPVFETHSSDVLSAIPRFTAINSALEIDLMGQANAEFLGGRQVSGIGGLNDFLRAAARSEGGKPIIALNATAKGGALSRIVPKLTGGAVSVGRGDVAIVVTEFGSADLRGLSLDDRAKALITLAAPAHREGLERDWREMRARL